MTIHTTSTGTTQQTVFQETFCEPISTRSSTGAFLEEAALERIKVMEKMVLQYAKKITTEEGDKWVVFSIGCSELMTCLASSFEEKGMFVKEVFYRGDAANHILGFSEKYQEGVGIRVVAQHSTSGVEEAKNVVATVMTALGKNTVTSSAFLAELENDLRTENTGFVKFTLGTAPCKITIHLMLDAQSSDAFCRNSAESIEIVCNPQGELRVSALVGYDLERSLKLLQEGRFDVVSAESACAQDNGLFSYCEQLGQGRLPLCLGVEKFFCEGFVRQYPEPGSLEGSLFFRNAMREHLTGCVELEKQAFLFTLENILSRSSIPEEERHRYCAILRSSLRDWDTKKQSLFATVFKTDSQGFYDSLLSSLAPRYLLPLAEGLYVFMETPSSSFEISHTSFA